jgi:hypothetical protein
MGNEVSPETSRGEHHHAGDRTESGAPPSCFAHDGVEFIGRRGRCRLVEEMAEIGIVVHTPTKRSRTVSA